MRSSAEKPATATQRRSRHRASNRTPSVRSGLSWADVNNVLVAARAQPWREWVVTRNAWGILSKRSHLTASGNPKINYSKLAAEQAAVSLHRKTGAQFSAYKCAFCTGYHIGRDRTLNHSQLEGSR